uniref:Uncharacterized protein n=1 Tax=Cacopsylla melanoneura TaxID=428564 RepID=A0A8D8WQ79_9HEMI
MCLKTRKPFHEKQQGIRFKSDLVVARVILFTIVTLLDMSPRTEATMNPTFNELNNPCGHTIKDFRHFAYNSKIKYPNITPEQGRKITNRALKHVGVSLGASAKYLESMNRSMAEIYPDISMMVSYQRYRRHKEYGYQFSESGFNWLPNKQFLWYKREVRCMTKVNKILTIFPILASSLKNFTTTFKELSLLRGPCFATYSDHILNIRNNLMNNLYIDVKKVLCVVSEGLENFGCDMPPTKSIDFRYPHWNSNPDCTGLITQDVIIIERYRQFLSTWKKILKLIFDTNKFNRQKTKCKKKPKVSQCVKFFTSKIKKKDGGEVSKTQKKTNEKKIVKKPIEIWDDEMTDNDVDDIEVLND